MTVVTTRDKEAALRAIITVWLKDQRIYCNNCQATFFPDIPPCCENPQIGKNIDHTMGLLKQNKAMRGLQKSVTGANESNTMRWGVSLPPDLYTTLNKYLQSCGEKGLFVDKKDLRWFMKKFPEFTIPQKI